MALQKKNHLIRAHLIVALFWFVVLFFALRGFDIPGFAHSLFFVAAVAGLGAISGVVLWISFDMSRTDSLLRAGGKHRFRGAKSSIGPVPVPVPAYKVARPVHAAKGAAVIPETFLPRKFAWWAEYQKNHPAHARAMRAVIRLMAQYPGLPASPVPGGHGGASLIDHSVNVVNTMMELAPKWSYRGHKNKKGEITFPLFDVTRIEHRFDHDDPILPLAALAHDVGKVACYELQKDGSVSEVKKNHDIEGARLLRTLPEIMSLPWKERVALLTACEYYHHIGSIPLSSWIDDRARSLIELLIVADIETGRREGGMAALQEQAEERRLPAGRPDFQATAENLGGAPEQATKNKHNPALNDSAGSSHGSALDLTYSLLLEPGRVNGSDTTKRIAWKYGDYLYINDAKLRNAVDKRLGSSDYAPLPQRGVMHPWTLELMELLANQGHLLQEVDGKKYSEKRAIFNTVSNVPGKTEVEQKFVIVAQVAAFPGLENTPDCRSKPMIAGPSWGEGSAINKKGGSEDESGGEVGIATGSGDGNPSHDLDGNHQETNQASGQSSPDDFDLPYPVTAGDVMGKAEPGPSSTSEPEFDLESQIRNLAKRMELPHRIQVIDGVKWLFVEEALVSEKWPGIKIDLPRFKGGGSGVYYLKVSFETRH